MARVRFTQFAAAQLNALTSIDRLRVTRKLFLLAELPAAGRPLFDEWEGCRALYSGHIRIIYFLSPAEEVEILYIRSGRRHE